MKYLFKIAVIILVVSPVSFASIDEIIKNGMFGCHIISDSIPGVDEYITALTLKEMYKDSIFMSIYKTPREKPSICGWRTSSSVPPEAGLAHRPVRGPALAGEVRQPL